jgi:NAD(P)H-flavin reductase
MAKTQTRASAADMVRPRPVVVSVSGPYGEASFIPSTFSSVMIVIGGSGVSFGLAHLEGLVSDCLAGDGRTREVELVWIVREAGQCRLSPARPYDLVKFRYLTDDDDHPP